jgi:hypothetical protein
MSDAQKDLLEVPTEDRSAPGWGDIAPDGKLPEPGQDVDPLELAETYPPGYEFTRRDGSHSR